MATIPDSFILPDLMFVLPFKHSFNPHYERAAKASSAWVNSYWVVPERKRAFFQQGGNELLSAHAFPYAGYEELRIAMDMINILFVIDEVSDDQNGKDADKTGHAFLDALRDPDWQDGSALAQMTKQLREKLVQSDVPACYGRLLRHCEDYVNAVTAEAGLREHNKVLDPEAYINARRENSAVRVCFGLFGFIFGLDLPDEIFEHPVMIRLHLAAVDMVWLSNVTSNGAHGNNVVTVVMESQHCDLQTAADHVGLRFKQLVDSFEADKLRLPSWGPQRDAIVAKFVMAMESWVVGNCEWSFDTPRYFGVQREEVRRTRVVEYIPGVESMIVKVFPPTQAPFRRSVLVRDSMLVVLTSLFGATSSTFMLIETVRIAWCLVSFCRNR
ncbi:isoprenoid synthase domain-containing protein [Fomitopsis serialis]|uniref:isoprenoid synthase domain-containing protein n=1 Tax=Fomitopsis serialis TaxID=139415 RepID=UPI0020088098|nr:isoprenoid synthase domain-containing protein [Neoantrodia serialis]KAH9915132.1 isoprenoid synthase domain-containing protein [Neoantrodia serialis]